LNNLAVFSLQRNSDRSFDALHAVTLDIRPTIAHSVRFKQYVVSFKYVNLTTEMESKGGTTGTESVDTAVDLQELMNKALNNADVSRDYH